MGNCTKLKKKKAAKHYARTESLNFIYCCYYSLNFLHLLDLVHAVVPLDVLA